MLLVMLLVFLLLMVIQNILYVLFFYFWRNRDFSIRKKDQNGRSVLLTLTYSSNINMVTLMINRQIRRLTLPSSFNGKKLLYG